MNDFYENWEIIEEIKFCNWLFDNENLQQISKAKITKAKITKPKITKRKLSNINYDTDETEIHIVKKLNINFDIW